MFFGEGTELGEGGDWGVGVGGGVRWMDWVVVEMGWPWAST